MSVEKSVLLTRLRTAARVPLLVAATRGSGGTLAVCWVACAFTVCVEKTKINDLTVDHDQKADVATKETQIVVSKREENTTIRFPIAKNSQISSEVAKKSFLHILSVFNNTHQQPHSFVAWRRSRISSSPGCSMTIQRHTGIPQACMRMLRLRGQDGNSENRN